MPPTASKTLSPAELQKLEHAFATDPASEAYKPLAEAYLAMGRHMEAMVVCKKGVKAHPAVADARVLLARVYADQGKDKKALEELQGALQVAPADKSALRLTGSLQLKGGEATTGKANLLKAFEADPKDEETLSVMQQFKVDAPRAEPPPPPPPPQLQPPPQQVQAQQHMHQHLPQQMQPHVQQPAFHGQSAAPVLQAIGQLSAPQGQQPQPGRPRLAPPLPSAQARARPSQPVRRPEHDDDEPVSAATDLTDLSGARHAQRSGLSRVMFFLLIFAVPVAAGAYYGIGQWRARVGREVKKALQKAGDELKHDTFDSYKKACAEGEAALDLDPGNGLAHSYLAYAYTVRWGEHERDDTMRTRAEEHLKEAREKKEMPTYLYAAEALFKYYSGKGAEGLKELEDKVKDAEAQNKRSALLYLTQGILSMSQGDLEHAKEALDKAQAASSDDPRIYVALGNLSRRRGNDGAALQAFNSALKFTRNSHPEGLLGTALLILDQENPGGGYPTAAKYIKTLLESDPPPSPRQLAQAHFARAFLISRVAADIPRFAKAEFQKQLADQTNVSPDPAKAKAEVTKEENEGVALDRTNPELNVIRGKRLYWEEKYDEAAAEIQKAIDGNSSMASYHVELAKVWMKKEGGEPQAEAALRKANALVPGSPKLLALLGQALYKGKKIDEARDTLEKAVADPKTKNPEARFALGKIYRDDKKDYDKAIVMFEKAALEYFADPTMAATSYDGAGQSWEAKGDNAKARSNYEKALNADKDFDESYCHYARFLNKLADPKDKDRLKATAQEFLKLNPRGECAADMQKLAGPPAPP